MNKNTFIKTINGDLNALELSKDRKDLEEKLISSLKDKGIEYLGNHISYQDSWHWHGEGDENERYSFFYRDTCGSGDMITYGEIPNVCSKFLISENLSSKLKRISRFISKKSYFKSLIYDLLKESTGKDFKVSFYKSHFSPYEESFSATNLFPIGKINFGLFLDSYNKEHPFEKKEKELFQEWDIEFYTERPKESV